MNNIANDQWPPIPNNVPSWIFFDKIYRCTRDFGATQDLKVSHRLARRSLLQQLSLMSNTRCKACSGYSHRARDCPTNRRLGMLGSSTNEWKRIIAWARVEVDKTEIERRGDLIQ